MQFNYKCKTVLIDLIQLRQPRDVFIQRKGDVHKPYLHRNIMRYFVWFLITVIGYVIRHKHQILILRPNN